MNKIFRRLQAGFERLLRACLAYREHASKGQYLLVGFAVGASLALLGTCGAPGVHRGGHAHHEGHAFETTWTCSMHPQVRQAEPGQCPICGMDLVPVASGTGEGEAFAGDARRVTLSERARALARLRTTRVRRQADAAAELRLLGRFEPNETTLKTVTAWTSGRIDRLHVNVTGERVRAGQVIAMLYSPEVFAAHQDLLVAKKQVERMQASPDASRQAAAAALEAARERLRLLGVPEEGLTRMEAQPEPARSVAIHTPFSGTVIERLATEGSYVSTGTPLYRIANLDSLWMQLDAYENDLPRLSVGQAANIRVESLPGEAFTGKVTFIDPTLDARRRTAQVRVQVDNRDGRLRPGMFAEATVTTRDEADPQSPLVIPAGAPLFTGRRAIVYVELRQAGGRVAYEARTVRLGPRLGEVYPVVAGLAEGERVVTRGAFALDADLQIRGGASMMTSADDSETGAWDGIIELSTAQRERLAPVVSAYLELQTALAEDELARAKRAAEALTAAVLRVRLERPEGARAAWSQLADALQRHGGEVAAGKDLQSARAGFEPLSAAMIRLLTRFGNPQEHALHLALCPMAFDGKGASWVQQGSAIHNAYYGAAMLSCGELQQEAPPGGYLAEPAADAPAASRPAPAAGHRH